MGKQINLDSWKIEHLTDLLRQGAEQVNKTNVPIVLYRQTIEESEGSYEEAICTLTRDYVVEQTVSTGGPIPPAVGEQAVYRIEEYPEALIRKSKDRFAGVIEALEGALA